MPDTILISSGVIISRDLAIAKQELHNSTTLSSILYIFQRLWRLCSRPQRWDNRRSRPQLKIGIILKTIPGTILISKVDQCCYSESHLQARASEHYSTIQNIVYISKSIYEVLILWDNDRNDSDVWFAAKFADYILLTNIRITFRVFYYKELSGHLLTLSLQRIN